MAIDPQTIANLLNIPNPAIAKRVEAKIDECLEKLNAKLSQPITRPEVEYDLKGHTAGWAISGEKIRLNLDLLNDPDYVDEMIEVTLPHEIAHIAQRQIWPNSKSHGFQWQLMMLYLGLPPDRTHTMKTKPARKTKRHRHECEDCGSAFNLTTTAHNRILRGSHIYYCPNCNGKLV